MISIHIEKKELWDERNNQFMYVGPDVPINLKLEHSLVSVSKWESKYHKPYTSTEQKTLDETLDYISMMVIGEFEDKLDKDIFKALSREDIQRIGEYIENPMTATTFSSDKDKDTKNKKVNNRIVTNELVYYWMTALNIPFECQYWHFNRLITLIKVCSIESDPDKNKKKTKFSSADMAARRARMEAARAKYKN